MAVTNEEIIDEIIRREGGDRFTDHPSDRGGPTKFGITQKAWTAYRSLARKGPRLVADLTLEEAKQFYRDEHVRPFEWIVDDKLREWVIDCSVNHGHARAGRWLQEAAGVEVDGVIGPKTRAAVNGGDAHTLLERLVCSRAKFYAAIVANDPTQARFIRGWIARALEPLCES